jgi:UDP-2,4-diacetamido-2,4,6-trideoxy-beta-L-altropyranose hydrolase
VIDDLADRPHDCDVLVDQTPGRPAIDYRPLVPPDCSILTGSAYALLDRRFSTVRAGARRRDGVVRRILVSMGATDPRGATLDVLAALQLVKLGIPVDVVLGGASPHQAEVRAAAGRLSPPALVHLEVDDMATLIDGADLAIGGGGVSALERCCLGVPSILLTLAENQRRNAATLSQMGAALIVEESGLRDADNFARTIRALVRDKVGLLAMSAAAIKVTDGLGTMRVRESCYRAPNVVPAGN